MNACASCRWIGSTEPGGYSTVIITAFLPARSGKPLVISGTTTASGALAADAASEQPINTAGTRLLRMDIAGSLSAVTSRGDCSPNEAALLDRSARQLNGSDAAFRQAIDLQRAEDRVVLPRGVLPR